MSSTSRLREAPELPTTSQPTPQDFLDVYEAACRLRAGLRAPPLGEALGNVSRVRARSSRARRRPNPRHRYGDGVARGRPARARDPAPALGRHDGRGDRGADRPFQAGERHRLHRRHARVPPEGRSHRPCAGARGHDPERPADPRRSTTAAFFRSARCAAARRRSRSSAGCSAAATEDRPGLRLAIAHADAPEWIGLVTDLAARTRPQGRVRARREPRRRRRHARRPGRGRLLLVPGLTPGGPILGRGATPAHTGSAADRFRGRGPRRPAGPAPVALPGPRRSRPASRRCRASAPAVRGRLAKLGLRTVGDLLLHRPRRYERPIDERPIRDLFGEEEAVIEGVVRGTSSRQGRGRLQDPHRPGRRRDGRDQGDVVQPAVARGTARPRHPRAPAREAEPLRLRRSRATTSARSARPPTTRPSIPASEALAQKQLRALVASRARARARRRRPAAGAAGGRRAAAACAPTRSWHCTALARRRRRRRAGGASPSTSCSSSSSRSRAAQPSASSSSRSRFLPPASSCSATARCSRSR